VSLIVRCDGCGSELDRGMEDHLEVEPQVLAPRLSDDITTKHLCDWQCLATYAQKRAAE
jgi:hypothetical protein